jgi:hypothetical protein
VRLLSATDDCTPAQGPGNAERPGAV